MQRRSLAYHMKRNRGHNPRRQEARWVSLSFFWAVLLGGWLLVPVAHGQRRFDQSKEIGLAVGTAYYLGDLNPHQHLAGHKKPAFGGYLRYNLDGRISLRGGLFTGTLEFWDADSDNPWQQNRNLHFRNQITEVSALVELNYLNHRMGNPKDQITAYLTTGLAVYNHMPLGQVEGDWFELQPLGTEGQGTSWGEAQGIEPYALTGLALPFGFGFKANVGPFLAFNVDWVLRKTWNDYLDDVSGFYANEAVLREEKGELAVLLADQSLSTPNDRQSQAGLQRGDAGRDDVYGMLTASVSFRVSKRPTTCWNQ